MFLRRFRSSRSGSVLFLWGVALTAALWMSNPTSEHYRRYLEGRLQAVAATIDPSIPGEQRSRLDAVLASRGRQLMRAVARERTRRYSIGVVSFYLSDLAEIRMVSIGIAGTFIPLRGHEEGTLLIGRLIFQG